MASEGHEGVPLSVRFAHARDQRISFSEEAHVYTLDEKYVFPRSVSKLVHINFRDFDGPGVVRGCIGKWMRDPESKYYDFCAAASRELFAGMSVRDTERKIGSMIVRAWSANGARQSALGTALHRAIELRLNGATASAAELAVPTDRETEPGASEAECAFAPDTYTELVRRDGAFKLRAECARDIIAHALAE